MTGKNVTSKAAIRKQIWDHLENNNLARFPRPVHNRIPNFVGAGEAAEKVRNLPAFQASRTVKVNPDKPQEDVRFYTLEARKNLLVPTPRLRSGLFNQILPPNGANKQQLRRCSTREGIQSFSKPLGLDADIKIDIIVIGSVAVSKQGHRIGKGEGYADMEYAMMRTMGAVDENTLVVSTLHDCQVYETLPETLFTECDLPVDVIITPSMVHIVETKLPKPKGIIWSMLTPTRLKDIPILRVLRDKERRQGKDVRLREEDCPSERVVNRSQDFRNRERTRPM